MGTIELAAVGLAGSRIGTALAGPMVWPRARPLPGMRLVGGWLLSVSAIAALISARLLGWLPATAAVEHSINLLGLLAYPLVYLYVRQQARGTAEMRSAWWLWTPAAAYLAAVVGRGALDTSTRVPFAWLLPVLLLFTGVCVGELRRSGPARPLTFLPATWVVASLVVLNLAQVVRLMFGHVAPVPALVPTVLTFEFAGLVALVAWRLAEAGPAVEASSAAPRYERSGLERAAALALLARLDHTLAVDRLFADQGLTLGRLAAAVGCTPHQVSEVLNRYRKVTFHEFLNHHRVEDVKAQLRDPAADRFTVEGIGASAGFGSRSAMYAAFRRAEGVTPTEFRRRRSSAERG